jgi:hypothetical protein
MYPEDLPLHLKDCSEMELYLASNLKKITSSRYLLALLKEYLDEPDEKKRQLLAAQMYVSMEDRTADTH